MGCCGGQALRRGRVRWAALAVCVGGAFGVLFLYGTGGPAALHHAFLLSRHVQTYPVLLRPRPCPGSRPPTLLLAVKSGAGHGERRAALRDTWAGPGGGVCTLFLLGRAAGAAGQRAVLEESRRHGDVLQWDFRESFFNVTLKELLLWHWLAGPAHRSHGSAPYVLRTDDDVFVDVGGVLALLRLLRARPGPAPPLYMGRAFVGTYPVRLWWNKYYVPSSLYPNQPYPPYLGGGGYLVSRETVQLFRDASASVPLFPIDDVYVGMCARAANVSAQHHPAFMPLEFSWWSSPCAYAGVLVLHQLDPAQLRQHWSSSRNHSDACRPAAATPPSL